MKMQIWMFLAALVIVAGCERQPKSTVGMVEGEDSMHAAKESALRTREQYSQAIGDKLRDLSAKIAAMKTKAMAMSGTAKTDFEKQISALEEQIRDLRNRLARVATTSTKQWENVRKDIEVRLKNLEDTFAQVSAQFSA